MKLADFIEQQRHSIVTESVEYAATLLPRSRLDIALLSDHIPAILDAIVSDLREPQTRAQSVAKSRDQRRVSSGSTETAAQTHGLLRAHAGMDIRQLVAEYRALRACVLRLWVEAHEPGEGALVDTIRFNEAIDQAVAESVAYFSDDVERQRQIFLGVLGHDLRGPLNAILLTSELLSRLTAETPLSEHSSKLVRSGRRMSALLDDLLEYSRGTLGVGVVVMPTPVDLADACREELEILQMALPETPFEFSCVGETKGSFDASRIREALGNLASNAATYGTPGVAVKIRLEGSERRIRLSVENSGKPYSREALEAMFEPLRRGSHTNSEDNTHLGLGLFTVRQIARAHGGDVAAHSDGDRIMFTMEMPKVASPS